MAFAETAKLLAELGLVDKLTPGLKKAGGSLGKFESRLGRTAGGLGKISSGLTRAGTVVAGAAVTGLGAAAKAAIDFEDAFAGVKKTVDETDLRAAGLTFSDLSDALRKMSLEMPNTAVELADIAANAGALGVRGKDIAAFTRQVAILASTTNLSADEASTGLGQLQNVIGLTGDEFDNFAAALVDLGNKGASTEAEILEIARRAGGSAHLIGIAKDATLGWAAAVANLGIQPELAGTGLQRFFLRAQSIVTSGRKPLELFAKVSGKSAKDFAKAFNKDATGALRSFIKGLSGLSKGDRLQVIQKLFGKGTGLTRTILGLAGAIDNPTGGLNQSLRDSVTAWDNATAAEVEFAKRNATVKSAFARLRNGIIDAAVTLGEGFAPALGRSAEQLSTFLKSDDNRQALKSLGEDIGKSIDAIDWKEVLDGAKDFVAVLKVALDYAKKIFDAVNALPTEVKAAGVGFLALNKVSGGLIGSGISDIVGSVGGAVARGAAGRVPGLGKLVAQPVIVTNWPPGLGMGGGAAGAAGAAGRVSKLGRVAGGFLGAVSIVGSVASAVETQQAVSQQNTRVSQGIKGSLDMMLAQNPTRAQMQTSLSAVESGIAQIRANPLNVLVQGEALTNLEQMRDRLKTALDRPSRPDLPPSARTGPSKTATAKDVERTTTAVEKLRGSIDLTKTAVSKVPGPVRDSVRAMKDRVAAASEGTTAATRAGASTVASATSSGASMVASAVRSSRPIVSQTVTVNVSAAGVTSSVTKRSRYGPSGGSAAGTRDRDSGFHPGGGGA